MNYIRKQTRKKILSEKGKENQGIRTDLLSKTDKKLNINKVRNHNTQKEIAKELGRNQVSQYFMLINKIATKILDYAKDHQEGRVAQNATNVTFNFTKWHKHFRNC